MKTRFHISGRKIEKMNHSIFMSVIVPINIIVPVYASAADVADNNSSVYIGNGYVVYYDIKSSWGNNQNIEIKIKNNRFRNYIKLGFENTTLMER